MQIATPLGARNSQLSLSGDTSTLSFDKDENRGLRNGVRDEETSFTGSEQKVNDVIERIDVLTFPQNGSSATKVLVLSTSAVVCH